MANGFGLGTICVAAGLASAATVLVLDSPVTPMPADMATELRGDAQLVTDDINVALAVEPAAFRTTMRDDLDPLAVTPQLYDPVLQAGPTLMTRPPRSKSDEQLAYLHTATLPLQRGGPANLANDTDLRTSAAAVTSAWSTETVQATPPPISVPSIAALPQRRPSAQEGGGERNWSKRLTERLAEISPRAKRRLRQKFTTANIAWPPHDVSLVAIKDEKAVEMHARASEDAAWKLVHRYPVFAASGVSGPKLKRGDKQVPEGIYDITFLNPDSRYHVSMRVNYPNTFDRQMAEADGRTNLGGDIMIHGRNVSAGCLAMGDTAIEELFVLAAEIGLPNIKVIIAPTDFRRGVMPERGPDQPRWLPKLYTQVASAMSQYPRPPSSGLLSFFGN